MKKTVFFCLSFVVLSLQIQAHNADLHFKVGQMLFVGFSEKTWDSKGKIAEAIAKHSVGGIIFYNQSYDENTKELSSRNIVTADQMVQLIQNFQKYWKEQATYNALPLLIGVDMEGGMVDRLPAIQGFDKPSLTAQALGLYNNPLFTENYAESIATCLQKAGFNVNFAPVVDLNVNPINPIIGGKGRSFSSDYRSVIEQAQAFILGHHKKNLLNALKHFPGHGSSSTDTHEGFTDVSKTWKEEELKPFEALVNQGFSDFIMTAHVVNATCDDTLMEDKEGKEVLIPMTFSKKMITDLVKEQWKFKGVVISDDLSMGAIAKHFSFEEALVYAINAGVDMLIVSNHHGKDQTEEAIQLILKNVSNGKISKKRIEDAYQRICRLKSKLGKL